MGGRVFTAAHCVEDVHLAAEGELEGSQRVSVAFRDDFDVQAHMFEVWYDYALAHYDDVQDVAVLVPLSLRLPPAEAHLSADGWWVGREVVTVGHPHGLVWTVTTGHLSGLRYGTQWHPEQVWLQMSSPIAPGNSGGPVFNRYGEVIGLAIHMYGAHHLGGAVPFETLVDLVDKSQSH